MRADKLDANTGALIRGNDSIGHLLDSDIALIPMVFDPHGKRGPLLENFLFNTRPIKPQIPFEPQWNNAAAMHDRITTFPCPMGIIPTATAVWSQTRTTRFYGGSYSAPTPRIHTLQQIGLTVTKAYALHMRHALSKLGQKPAQSGRASSSSATISVASAASP